MNEDIRTIITVSTIIGLLYCCVAFSVKNVKNENEFYRKIQYAPFTVTLFYKDSKTDRIWNENMAKQRRNFKKLSHEGFFVNGDVQFIEADILRKKLDSVKNDFRISVVPSVLLFKYGKVVRDETKKPALLFDKKFPFLEPAAIKSFINSYLRDDIEDYIEENTERKVEDRIMRDYSGYITYGSGFQTWPYYSPYYYGPYYGGYYGPGVGFGVSVGF